LTEITQNNKKMRDFWLKVGLPILAMVVIYLGIMAATSGIRGEQLLVAAVVVGCLLINDRTRDFAARTLPLTLFGIVYDLTHITEPLVQKLYVHVAEPYRAELALFGINTPAGRITLSQYFALHHWPWMDLVTGTGYLAFVYWALFFGFFLVWTGRTGDRRRLAAGYAWAFLGMNVAGFATYYIYPAAPPWYVAQYGLGPANFAAVASPAAGIRWDQLTGLHFFESFYSRSADIFGAIPSLHAAQPLLVFLYARRLGHRWLNVVHASYYLLVCFGAIYLQHHYLIDVLIGSAYALSAYGLERAWSRHRAARRELNTNSSANAEMLVPLHPSRS
jgi:hypothetical protein